MTDLAEDLRRSLTLNDPSSVAGSSGSFSSAAPSGGLGGLLDSLNSSLRADLESTRREVSVLRAEVAARGALLQQMADDDADDDALAADELARIQELLAEPLSDDDDDEPTQAAPTRPQADRKTRARTADKSAGIKTKTSVDASTKSVSAGRRVVSAAAAHSASAAAATSPWEHSSGGVARPIASPLSSSSSSSSPHASLTAQRSRDVLSNFRAQQSTIAAYEAEQLAKRQSEGEPEGTIKLKADLGEQCAICIVRKDDMVALDRVASLSCLHTFHAACILEWMKRSTACPLCKTEGFHPLAAVARRQETETTDMATTNGHEATQRPISSRSTDSSRRLGSASSRPSSSAAQQRPTSALLDAATRSRLRQLRAERLQADGAAENARRTQSAMGLSSSPASNSFDRRAASAANRAVAAAAASSSARATPGQMSLSQLLAHAPQPGSSQYALLTSSAATTAGPSPARAVSASSSSRAASRPLDPLSRTTTLPSPARPTTLAAARGSSGSSGPITAQARPSSNSSNIRAAAAASLSLAPTVTRAPTAGRLVTGSTLSRTSRLTN